MEGVQAAQSVTVGPGGTAPPFGKAEFDAVLSGKAAAEVRRQLPGGNVKGPVEKVGNQRQTGAADTDTAPPITTQAKGREVRCAVAMPNLSTRFWTTF